MVNSTRMVFLLRCYQRDLSATLRLVADPTKSTELLTVFLEVQGFS